MSDAVSADDMETVGVIGYGEVGEAFAGAFREQRYNVLVINRSPERLRERLTDDSIRVADSLPSIACESDVLISCVWPDTAARVARECVEGIEPGTLYVDLNSIGPGTVNDIMETVSAAGASFVNVSVMDSVRRFGTDVLLTLAGPGHDRATPLFRQAGSQVQDLGSDPVRPAVLKLCRSTVTKGMIAVFAEALIPALQYDLTEEVLESVDKSFERQTISDFARFFLADTTDHAQRRYGELEEVCSMMQYVDVHSPITEQALWLNRTVADADINADDYRTVLRELRPFYQREATADD
jgi:3-hydroxyisobutyrate dehydrogenase